MEKSVRETPKEMKKGEKSCKKVLTFFWESDRIYKSHGARHSPGSALNLENDTEQEKRKQETVIPNELNLAGEPVKNKGLNARV